MNWWVLRRKPHVSWLIALFCLGFLIGVYVARYVDTGTFSSTIWVISGGLLCVTALLHRYLYLVPILIIGAMMVGLWRGSSQTSELANTQQLYGQKIVAVGTVREDVDSDASGRIVMRVDRIELTDQPMAGMLWVSTKTDLEIKRSDRVTFEGKLTEGFGSFVGTVYQAQIQSVERPRPGDVALAVRDWFAGAIRTAIPDPEASLGIGYLVGQKRALPMDLAEALQIAGLTHIVVASGYNLTILVRLARRLFEKVSKYLSALSAGAMIASFVAVTGMSPSMSRAGLVAGLSLAAWYYGRRFHPVILLVFAAAVTVMINPSYIWGDLGWQLSFAAFAGVMILAPLLQRFFFGENKPSFVRQILGETTAAVIVTAPILVSAFGQFSNVAVIANILILPLVPLAMLLTFTAGIGALIVPGFATIIGLPATWLLGYMTQIAHYFADLPWALSTFELSSTGVGVAYGLLICLCVWLWKVTKYDLRNANIVE